jgi:hypothetical protein
MTSKTRAAPGVFDERYWTSVVVPIRGPDGPVDVLEFSAREVTPIIEQYKELQSEEKVKDTTTC